MYKNVYMHLGAVVPSKNVKTKKLFLKLQFTNLQERRPKNTFFNHSYHILRVKITNCLEKQRCVKIHVQKKMLNAHFNIRTCNPLEGDNPNLCNRPKRSKEAF